MEKGVQTLQKGKTIYKNNEITARLVTMKYVLLILLCTPLILFGQHTVDLEQQLKDHYKGGPSVFYKDISENITYPETAIDNCSCAIATCSLSISQDKVELNIEPTNLSLSFQESITQVILSLNDWFNLKEPITLKFTIAMIVDAGYKKRPVGNADVDIITHVMGSPGIYDNCLFKTNEDVKLKFEEYRKAENDSSRIFLQEIYNRGIDSE